MSVLSTSSALSSLLSVGAGRVSVNGLATGMDTDSIVKGLLAIEQSRIDGLKANQARVQQQQAAFKGIEARLLAFQGQLTQLGRTQNGVFDLRTASSSDESLLGAAASSSATAGSYQLKVNALARAHQVASQGFDGLNSAITQGTLQIRLGSGPSATITIDANNNTLQGLATAINNAGLGITATIINDGSTTNAQPYRLLLTASKTGVANSISITNNLAADSGGAVKPVFDSTFVGPAVVSQGYSGTALPTANRGAGNFSGSANNTYTFTVLTNGTVGTDNNLQVSYTDSTGTNTGTITLNAADVDTYKTVAEGIQVKFNAGTLVAGETFTIKGYVPVVQQAVDASVTLGTGAGALTVHSATNQIDGLFTGVSVDLKAADPAKTITLTVANDVNKARQGVQDFVNGFNDLMQFIDEQIKFDSANGSAGPLLGQRQALTIQQQVRDTITRPIPGLKSQMNRLGALGISVTDQGRLSLNQAKLDDALAGRLSGVSLDDVRRLFALAGTSSNTGVQFVSGSAQTRAAGTPYQVVVTQAAEQASIVAGSDLAASTVLTSANNTLLLSVDGSSAGTVTLTPGTYTRSALAQEIETQINASTDLGGRRVAATLNGNRLVLTSSAYGASSRVTLSGGSAAATLGFTGTETDQGVDVAGHYEVDGQSEAATGSGQFLIGAADGGSTTGLQTRITLTPAQVGGGVTADLTLTRGMASSLDVLLGNLLDPVTGRLKTIDTSYQTTIDDIASEITRQNDLLAARRDRLLKQFAAMERTVSQLQSIGNFLGAQLTQVNSTRR